MLFKNTIWFISKQCFRLWQQFLECEEWHTTSRNKKPYASQITKDSKSKFKKSYYIILVTYNKMFCLNKSTIYITIKI